jgi:hypothetical protein
LSRDGYSGSFRKYHNYFDFRCMTRDAETIGAFEAFGK